MSAPLTLIWMSDEEGDAGASAVEDMVFSHKLVCTGARFPRELSSGTAPNHIEHNYSSPVSSETELAALIL